METKPVINPGFAATAPNLTTPTLPVSTRSPSPFAFATMETKPVINPGFAATAPNLTTRELISTLRSTFIQSELETAEQILLNREENTRNKLSEMSIQRDAYKESYDLLLDKNGRLTLAKLELEDEVIRLKVESEREANRCKFERNELSERVSRLGEEQRAARDREARAEERNAELSEDLKKAEEGRAQVVRENGELKRAKCVAEAEVEAWKKRFGELNERVSRLEKDIATLVAVKINSAGGGGGGNIDLVQLETLGSHKEIKTSPCAGSSRKSPGIKLDLGLQEAGLLSSKVMASGCGGVGRSIIMIDDSDDERPAQNGTASVSNGCTSDFISSEKEITSEKVGKMESSGQAGKEIEKSSIENPHLTSALKRKQQSDFDSDDDFPIGRRRMKNLKDIGHQHRASPVNQCVATPNLGDTNVAQAAPPANKKPAIRHCEAEPDAKHNSQKPSKNLHNADSSDPGDVNGNMATFATPNLQVERAEVWSHWVDLRLAFDTDLELCMKGVCALHRQLVFSHLDAPSGTALAKFLIKGDKEGKLTKCATELPSSVIGECQRLAIRYAKQLFEIYQKREDSFFLPCLK